MNIEDIYQLFCKHPIISIDSRNIAEDSIFFALKGENFDGNKFVLDAINKGAAYSITDNSEYGTNSKCIVVENVLETLQNLANFHRKNIGLPIIAITGTNGKTTTKELLSAILSTKYKVISTKGNLNNHIGVPLTLLSMDKSTEIGIVEMGANHINEIKLLCEIAAPNFGLITNVGRAHLEGFGSFDGVIQAKTELYQFLGKNKGRAFYNSENEILKNEIKKYNFTSISYGINDNDYCKGKLISSNPFLEFSVFNKKNNSEIVKTNLVGEYNLENAMAASCVGLYLGVSMDNIKSAIYNYIPSNNRSQLHKKNDNILLLDCYNANPSSMEAAIYNFSTMDTQGLTKILILGEMLELGNESDKEHQKIVQLIKNKGFREVYFVGKGFKIAENENYRYFEDSKKLQSYLENEKIKKAFILIKGSRGVKLETIINCFD
jgi:UDP-N-acetylmuramoyl-tripeptide--D-alanyl-D-alanine ligase